MMRKSKAEVLIVCAHRRGRSPSQRYRFEQYLDFLENQGFSFTFAPFLNAAEDNVFYSKGRTFSKLLIIVRSTLKRVKLLTTIKSYDLIFIQREAHFLGSSFFERSVARCGKPLIFDFDDSIWLADTSPGNKKWEWLKNPAKFINNIKSATLVIAGNQYLAQRAGFYNKNIVVIPTTINTEFHKPLPRHANKDRIIIGWSGSLSTLKHFELLLPVLLRLKEEMPEKIAVKIMGAALAQVKFPGIIAVPWTEEKEVAELNSFDIGVMPLPDDEWSKGKCGLKALSYMACEIATVASKVGVNSEIVQNGENGLIAGNEEEWYYALKLLIEDEQLRRRLGKAGRDTVIKRYSVAANKKKYLEAFNFCLASGGKQ